MNLAFYFFIVPRKEQKLHKYPLIKVKTVTKNYFLCSFTVNYAMGILYNRTGEPLPEVQDLLKPAVLNLDKCIQEENSDSFQRICLMRQRICLMRMCPLRTGACGMHAQPQGKANSSAGK